MEDIMCDKVSIIVPVYNSESTIGECLNSLISQTYKNLEIIVVNDGSTDGSLKVCKSYADKDNRILVYNLENRGVSHARNFGLSKCTGYWIMFIDSDDFISINAIEKILKYDKVYNFDICCWNSFFVDNNIIKKMSNISPAPRIYNNQSNIFIDSLFSNVKSNLNFGDMFRAVWGKLYKRSLIINNNIYFDENLKSGEDAIWLLDYFHFSYSILMVNDYLNYYRLSQESFMGKYKSNYIHLEEQQLKSMKKKLVDYNLNEEENIAKFTNMIIYSLIANNFKYSNNFFKVLFKTRDDLKFSAFHDYSKRCAANESIFKKICTYLYKYGLEYLSLTLYMLNYRRNNK